MADDIARGALYKRRQHNNTYGQAAAGPENIDDSSSILDCLIQVIKQ